MMITPITLRDLDSVIAPGTRSAHIPQDMSKLLGSSVVKVNVPLTWKHHGVDLNLWVVLGAESLVFCGPQGWKSRNLSPWLFFDHVHFADFLLDSMDEYWAEGANDPDNTAEFFASILDMFKRLNASIAPPTPLAESSGEEPPLETTLQLI